MAHDGQLEYDVSLSFAGEDRDYVEGVAKVLKGHGIRVFYDRFEEVELWGKDLYTHLDEIYRKKSRFCVMFISESYAKKAWTNHERTSAQARAFTENQEYVLPARFDNTELPGLRRTVGYVDLRQYTSVDFAKLIIKKLGPIVRGPSLPEDLGRLYRLLGIRSKKAMERVRSQIRHLHRELSLLTEDERRFIFRVFVDGCPGDLPDNMHVHVERLERAAGFPLTQVKELATALSVIGIDVKTTRRMVKVEVWDNRVNADPENLTDLFEAMVSVLAEEHCIECGERLFVNLDFGPLSPSYPEVSLDIS